MASPHVQQLIAKNAKFAETWPTPPTMIQMRQGGMEQPVLVRKSYLFLTRTFARALDFGISGTDP